MILKEIYKYNNDWIKVAYSYLRNKEDAEDLIQEVYIKIHTKLNNGKINDITYKNTINKYFVYKVIRNAAIDFLRKKKSYVDIENINIKIKDDICENEEAKSKMFVKIADEIKHWNDREKEIFEMYMYSGLSMKSLSMIFHTSKSSIFNSIDASRKRIKHKFGEDMEDYFNNQYDLI